MIEGNNLPEAHIMGLHEDMSLRLSDVKYILDQGLQGKLIEVEEKIDGQNFTFTVVKGSVRYLGKGYSEKRSESGGYTRDEMVSRLPKEVSADFLGAFDDVSRWIRSADKGIVEKTFIEGRVGLECSLVSKMNPGTIGYSEDQIRKIRFSSRDSEIKIDKDLSEAIVGGSFKGARFSILPKPSPVWVGDEVSDNDLSFPDSEQTVKDFVLDECRRKILLTGMRNDHAILAAERIITGTPDHTSIKRVDRSGKLWESIKRLEGNSLRTLSLLPLERLVQPVANKILSRYKFEMPVRDGWTESLSGVSQKILSAHAAGKIRILRSENGLMYYPLDENWKNKMSVAVERISADIPLLNTEGIVFKFAGKRYKMTGMYTAHHRLHALFKYNSKFEKLAIYPG